MKEIRNWLIRTNNCQILGPVTVKKVRDLLQNGALDENDELCSGNGYWFYVREKDLIKKYLNENFVQDFNPISEAKKTLSYIKFSSQETKTSLATASRKFVDEKSLNEEKEFEVEDDITLIQNPASLKKENIAIGDPNKKNTINQSSNIVKNNEQLNEEEDEEHIPSQKDLEYPD